MPIAIETKSYARQYKAIWGEVQEALTRTFFEDDPILGGEVERFERALARYHEVRFAVGVGSGTDAIALMLRGLGIGLGHEVITCAHAFPGVIAAIRLSGARPLLVDAEPELGLLPADRVEAAITGRTRAILAGHVHGHPADVTALYEVALRRGVMLLEDAAQAHGARWQGRAVGSFGTAATQSFHPGLTLGAFGDGGAVLTDDPELAARLRVLRNLGRDSEERFAELGPESKLDTLQAAILGVKLRHLGVWVSRRRELAAAYLDGLRGVGDLRLPEEHVDARHAYNAFVVRTGRRDALQAHLRRAGIRTEIHYAIPAHRQPGLMAMFPGASFPVAERLAETVLSLPLSHEHEPAEIDRVIEEVRGFFGGSAV